MFVFQQNVVSEEAAALIADIALLSGHIGKPRDGILEVKAKNNSQGLVDMGIHAGAEAMEGVKGLMIFGEDPKDVDLSGLEFLAVSDIYLTETAKKADVFLPGTGFASTDGTYTNTERRLLPVEAVIDEDVDFSNWEIAAELAHVFEEEFGFEDEVDISWEMDDTLPLYKYAEIGEVLGRCSDTGRAEVRSRKGCKDGRGTALHRCPDEHDERKITGSCTGNTLITLNDYKLFMTISKATHFMRGFFFAANHCYSITAAMKLSMISSK